MWRNNKEAKYPIHQTNNDLQQSKQLNHLTAGIRMGYQNEVVLCIPAGESINRLPLLLLASTARLAPSIINIEGNPK